MGHIAVQCQRIMLQAIGIPQLLTMARIAVDDPPRLQSRRRLGGFCCDCEVHPTTRVKAILQKHSFVRASRRRSAATLRGEVVRLDYRSPLFERESRCVVCDAHEVALRT
jgi:hypothetical protein